MISQNPSVRHICRFVWCWRVCLPLFLYLFMSFSFIQEAEGTKRPEFRERRSYIHGRWRAWCKSKKAKLTVSDFLVWRSFLSFFLSFLFLLRFRARKNYSNRQESFEESKLFFNDESKWKWNIFAEEYFVHRLKFDGKWKETFDSHFIPIVHQRIFFDQGNLLLISFKNFPNFLQ